MCRFASAVITKTSVLCLKDSDSHTDILAANKIDDSKKSPDFVKVEIVPTGANWLDIDKWEFSVDQDELPSWWNPVQDEHRARLALRKRLPNWNGNLKIKGYIDLSSLTSLPANAKLSAGGNLALRRLKGNIPTGVVTKGNVIR